MSEGRISVITYTQTDRQTQTFNAYVRNKMATQLTLYPAAATQYEGNPPCHSPFLPAPVSFPTAATGSHVGTDSHPSETAAGVLNSPAHTPYYEIPTHRAGSGGNPEGNSPGVGGWGHGRGQDAVGIREVIVLRQSSSYRDGCAVLVWCLSAFLDACRRRC